MKVINYPGHELIADRSDTAGEYRVQQVAIHFAALFFTNGISLLLLHRSSKWDVLEGLAEVRSLQKLIEHLERGVFGLIVRRALFAIELIDVGGKRSIRAEFR